MNSKKNPKVFEDIQKSQTIEKATDLFNQRWESFWKSDISIIGRVLTAHLILEYYMDQYIYAANPALKDLSKIGLNFYKKLEIVRQCLPDPTKILDGIASINKIRNTLAHNINATIPAKNLATLRLALKTGRTKNEGSNLKDNISLITTFTEAASAILHFHASFIKKIGHGKGLIAYNDRIIKSIKRFQRDFGIIK